MRAGMILEWSAYYFHLTCFALTWWMIACVGATAVKDAVAARLEDSETITLMGGN